MKLLVVHQVPYRKIDYRRALDHHRHDVTYVGFPDRMADLPADLRCRRVELAPDEDLVEGVTARTTPEEGYEHVLALSEFGILEACRIRAHLGLPGPTEEQVERVRDKVRMKEALAGSGIRAPRFVANPGTGESLPWSGRTVLKPRQGAASTDVTLHDTVTAALTAYWRLEDRGDFQLEEFVEGDILHADGLVSGGELVHNVVSRYVNAPVDATRGGPLGSRQVPHQQRYEDLTRQVVEVLEIEAGCVHLEFFETPGGELVFLEVANRMGGAGVVDAHLRHSGIHLPSHEIAIRLGLERPEPDEPSGRYHGWLVFPGHHLDRAAERLVDVPAWVREHPCLDRLHVLEPGQPLPDRVTYHEWLEPVFIEASHEDSEQLAEFLRACVRSVTVASAAAGPAAPRRGTQAGFAATAGGR